MPTIVKVYTFLDKITCDASEVNRNFDDLFTTINSLNSENIAAAFSHPASQVTIIDTASNYTSTNLEGVIGEPSFLQRGLNTIHTFPGGTGALTVYPGKVEIGGQICTVSTKFTTSGITVNDSGQCCGVMYVMCGKPATGEEITASDLFLVENSSVTVTASFSIANNGYYYNSKRLIGAVYSPTSGCQNLQISYNPDPVQKSFTKVYAGSTASDAFGAFGITMTFPAGGTGTYINLFSVNYDTNLGTFGYHAELVMNSATNAAQEIINGGGVYHEIIWELNSRASFGGDTTLNSAGNMAVSDALYFNVSEAAAALQAVSIVARPVNYSTGGNA